MWQTTVAMKRKAKSYSIVDHELLHRGYLARLGHQSLALYLFLVVVGDGEGRSFYAPSSIGKILRITAGELERAQAELHHGGLITYQKPYWHVRSLTTALPLRAQNRSTKSKGTAT
jgi:hypothetical protein